MAIYLNISEKEQLLLSPYMPSNDVKCKKSTEFLSSEMQRRVLGSHTRHNSVHSYCLKNAISHKHPQEEKMYVYILLIPSPGSVKFKLIC